MPIQPSRGACCCSTLPRRGHQLRVAKGWAVTYLASGPGGTCFGARPLASRALQAVLSPRGLYGPSRAHLQDYASGVPSLSYVHSEHIVNTAPQHVPHALSQVGVLQPSPDMGYTCLVEWASGSQGVYETGWRDLYELVHLEMSWTSGAPVVGQYWTGGAQTHSPNELLWGGRELQKPACLRAHGGAASGGTAYSGTAVRVERGTHWVYGGLDPDMGTIADAADGQQEGEPPPAHRSSCTADRHCK